MNTVYVKGMPIAELNGFSEANFSVDDSIEYLLQEIKADKEVEFHSKSIGEIRTEFRDALDQCLCHLELASIGQGFRYEMELSRRDVNADLHQRVFLIEYYINKQLGCLDAMEELYRVQSGLRLKT